MSGGIVQIENIPQELRNIPQWVLWSLEGKRKMPYQRPDGNYRKPAASDNPLTWTSLSELTPFVEQYSGVGFVFAETDSYAGVDFDDCILPDGSMKSWASQAMEYFPTTYAEMSQSGTGVHILCKGVIKEGGTGLKVFIDSKGIPITSKTGSDGSIEIYDRGRYFATTGNKLPNSPSSIDDCNQALGVMYEWLRAGHSAASGKKFKMDDIISEGNRHGSYKKMAASMRSFGSSEEEILAALMVVNSNKKRVATAKPEKELRDLARYFGKLPAGRSSAYAGGSMEPQPVPASTPGESVDEIFLPKPPDPGNIPLAPNDMARLIMEQHHLMIDQTDGVFEYTGQYWELISPKRIRSYTLEADNHTHTTTKRRSQAADYIYDAIRHRKPVAWRNLQPTEVPCGNGVIDVATHRIRPHRKEDYLETVIPVDYEPGARCYRWMEALAVWFKDDPDAFSKVHAMQEFFGYSLLPHARYKKALFLNGEGDTGKSQAAIILGDLVGLKNKCTISTRDMDDPMKRAPIVGKMINILTELPASAMISDGGFKQLVSTGDPIQIDPKHRPGFSYTPFCKHVICTNKLPGINDTSSATFNRILLIYFPNVLSVEKQDTGLIDKLRDELPGILSWSLEGAERLVKNGGEFTAIGSSKTMIQEYREEQNPMNVFIEEGCVAIDKTDNKQTRVALSEFREAYVKWNHNRYVEPKLIAQMLRSAGIQVGNRRDDKGLKQVRSVIGLRLKTANEVMADKASLERQETEPENDYTSVN